ncbi:MAG: excinuclease ABC subunit UvrA [Planctomycetota bacterium]
MIRIRNVRVNNLKGVDLDIPLGQLILFCGLSGSGKSSLAFDTLYAEGQRRYISSLSPQTRQFITTLDKPDADLLEGLPPAIAVQAFRGNVAANTTVGMATEVSDYLRVLFSEIATPFCPVCDQPIRADDAQSVAKWIDSLPSGLRFQICFSADHDDWATSLMVARKNGFSRAIVNDRTIELSRSDDPSLTNELRIEQVLIVVDRLKTGDELSKNRLIESLEIAFQFGLGSGTILATPFDSPEHRTPKMVTLNGTPWLSFSFSRDQTCSCGREVARAEPKLFQHTNKAGACVTCEGVGFLDKHLREPCDVCLGRRLNDDALAYRIGGWSISDLQAQSIVELTQAMKQGFDESENSWQLTSNQQQIARPLGEQVLNRLSCLEQVGLGYLTLGRAVRTLSAGEGQRVSLTSCLASTLVNTLYVLDEPSVGLHAADVQKLVAAIVDLNRRGNTVAVVDHEESLIRSVPRIVEIGPAAGSSGGEIVFDGSPEQLAEEGETITADFLAGRRGVSWNEENRRQPRGSIRLLGARGNNLKNIDVEFPLGCLTVVSGVSGSGKSSLVQQTLHGAICQKKQIECVLPLPFDDLVGADRFDEVVMVDRSPIGRTARSNPVTYVKAFDDIRRCFADTIGAHTKNLSVGKFSFNTAGGRCDQCEGAGEISIDMQFMPSIAITCDECQGTRFREDVLAVKYRSKSIADVLRMTVRQAFSFFRGQTKVQAKLKSLIDVGLEYIQLGQPATTLSCGEAQRLKLGYYLNAAKSKRALFLLDEPTTGLHMADVTKLLDCFETLIAVGHSLTVVEHDIRVIRNADWVIDLGPGAAGEGGEVVAAGTPETILQSKQSVTARWLG